MHQVPVVGVIGGIVKGFKKEKSNNAKNASPEYCFSQLEEIFSRPVSSGLSGNAADKEEEEELLDIGPYLSHIGCLRLCLAVELIYFYPIFGFGLQMTLKLTMDQL